MSNIELVSMESKAEAEMAPVLVRANSFVITDESTYHAADALITQVKDLVEVRKTDLGPTKESATETWQNACRLWKKYVTDPLEVCKILDRKRYSWKKAEDDRRTREAEALRREEQKRQEAERLALAERMEEAGMTEQAERVLDAPVAPVNVPAPVPVEKPQGQTYIENWQARVVDESLVPRDYMMPDLVALGKYAKLMKGKASMPGVEFFDQGTVRRAG